MPLLSEFERQAWERRTNGDQHSPATALKAALDDIESGKTKPQHVFVMYVEACEDDEEGGVGFYQAGKLGKMATEGALHRVIHIHWQEA